MLEASYGCFFETGNARIIGAESRGNLGPCLDGSLLYLRGVVQIKKQGEWNVCPGADLEGN